MNRDTRRSRVLLALLLVTSVVLVAIDRGDGSSPLDGLRHAASAVFGPVEQVAAAIASPVSDAVDSVSRLGDDGDELERLRERNEELTRRLRTSEIDRQRAAELDGLLRVAGAGRYEVVPARVIAIGAAQTFSWTVTIDAGTRDGIHPDMTVLNGDGLVGRVIAASPTAATVLLVVDPNSVVGGRLSSSMELGFISGEGDIGDTGRLRLELVDRATRTRPDDTVVTWGSHGGTPYVAGVPIGSVTKVLTSPRELSKTVLVEPYVDFSALDQVGVVVGVGHGTGQTTAAQGRGHVTHHGRRR